MGMVSLAMVKGQLREHYVCVCVCVCVCVWGGVLRFSPWVDTAVVLQTEQTRLRTGTHFTQDYHATAMATPTYAASVVAKHKHDAAPEERIASTASLPKSTAMSYQRL